MNFDQYPSPHFTKGRLWFFKPTFIGIHWINGPLAAADAVFTNKDLGKKGTPWAKEKPRSAHIGVGGQYAHQYVDFKDTAWTLGHWFGNLQSVNIELEGGVDLPVSDDTYDKAGEAISEVWLQCPSIPRKREALRPHYHFKNTACPGSVNIDRLFQIAMAHYVRRTAAPNPQPQPQVGGGMVTDGFPKTVVAVAGARRRSETNTSAQIFEQYKKDTNVQVVGVVQGENVNGSTEWYNTGYGYIWKGATK